MTRKQPAFSLIALLIVAVIIAGIFVLMLKSNYGPLRQNQKQEIKAELNDVQQQNDLYNEALINNLNNN